MRKTSIVLCARWTDALCALLKKEEAKLRPTPAGGRVRTHAAEPADGSPWVRRTRGGKLRVAEPMVRFSPGSLVAQKYRVLHHLGDGGMGSVWAVRNERTGGCFALKVAAGDVVSTPSLTARLLVEARAAGAIHHPNVVQVYDVGELDDGAPFLIMELLEGQSLQVRLKGGRLGLSEALELGVEIGLGLEAAHEQGVIHRDLKPGNVFLHGQVGGRCAVKVLDFGVSKVQASSDPGITEDGDAVGTPSYMSPEQARGKAVDARSDIWALGVMLFELLTGERPFDGPTSLGTLVRILDGPIPLLSEKLERPPPGITSLIHRCLSRDPATRPERAAEVVAALRVELARLAGNRPAPEPLLAPPTIPKVPRAPRLATKPTLRASAVHSGTAPPSVVAPTRPPGRRASRLALATAFGALALIGGTLYVTGVLFEQPIETPDPSSPSSLVAPDLASARAPELAQSAAVPPLQPLRATLATTPSTAPTEERSHAAQPGTLPPGNTNPQTSARREPERPVPATRTPATRERPRRDERKTPSLTATPLPAGSAPPAAGVASVATPTEAASPTELPACTPESLAPHCFGGLD